MESSHSAPRVRFAYGRLVRLGSAAAALASIIGLFVTVGDRASSLFGNNSANGVQLEKVALERIPFRRYLQTRENEGKVTGLGYSRKDLDANVLAVDFDARFKGWTKGATFPVKLTLESRNAAGRSSFAEHELKETLDAPNDFCGCHSFFFAPKHATTYRVIVQVFRSHAPNSDPLQSTESEWVGA